MIVFNSDLDNTLIYSYKKDIGKNIRCVEVYQGREISFMTETSALLLEKINQKLIFVPTTTRTLEQYSRINLGIGVPDYALVCNGGVLLEKGVPSEIWYNNTLKMIFESKGELLKSVQLLESDINRSFEIRFIDDLFVFTKSEQPEATIDYLKMLLNLKVVDVFNNGTKIYVVPKKLNKGNAIIRLRELLNPEKVIAAGDSEFDISMLQVADKSYLHKELKQKMLIEKDHFIMHEDDEVFSDFILKNILTFC